MKISNDNIEQVILSICLGDKYEYGNLIKLGLNERYFKDDRNRRLFKSIVEYRTNNPDNIVYITSLAVYKELGSRYFDELLDCEYIPSLATKYFEELKKRYVKREVANIVKETDYSDEGIFKLSKKIASIVNNNSSYNLTLNDYIDKTIEEVEYRYSDKKIDEFNTGWNTFDELGFMRRGYLYIVGGESGHGKSTFVLNLINKWIKKGLHVLVFENEMQPTEVLEKLGCIITKFPLDKCLLNKGQRLKPDELKTYKLAVRSIGDFKLDIFPQRHNLSEMALLIDIIKPDVFVLDTITALIPIDEKRKDVALGEIARSFKDFAGQYNALGVVVAQLKDLSGRPTEKNLIKESREIRDAADTMDFIYREEEKNTFNCPPPLEHVLEVFRVKGRFTGTGKAYLYYDRESGFIGELDIDARINAINYLNDRRK